MRSGDPDRVAWLLVSVSAGADASLSVAIWRRLRELGAVYLQISVALLPDIPAVAETIDVLVARVGAGGGQARVLHLQLEANDAEGIVAEQRGERDGEYAEVVERTPAFLDEIRSETMRGRVTCAEVEESEADLARFGRWLASITVRDYFGAPGGGAARAAVEACREALARFESAALTADSAAPPFAAPSTRLPSVVIKSQGEPAHVA